MSKIVETIQNLENLIPLKPASIEDIENVEIELALPLAKDYREYLLNFGAIMANDIELTGIAKSKNRNVVEVTKREWNLNRKIKHNLYVVENIGIDGIIIWQDSSGSIYESRPNYEAKKIANNLLEYIKSKQ
ncbi:SMI1/KNR4 family protein [Campylobacter ureolyticus]|uniref:SMI1/KNR4 family protein n=1 Tax=Campylobacter ureolyticus TaxID=827 RepID=UPI00291462BC|nr:SMI1/KNR4 family protein [Campylobacter ureolyticus]MDU5326668.1 SMI1/KNR4 family protein [Campylobacter ureolyticus]